MATIFSMVSEVLIRLTSFIEGERGGETVLNIWR